MHAGEGGVGGVVGAHPPAGGAGESARKRDCWNEERTVSPIDPPSDCRNCTRPLAAPTSASGTWFCTASRKTGKVRPTPKPRGIKGATTPPTGRNPNANFHVGVDGPTIVRKTYPKTEMSSPATTIGR